MKVKVTRVDVENYVEVKLSKRNLLTLLHKLEMEGSKRTILRRDGMDHLTVTAESDEAHYTEDRPQAGKMHPETEAYIKEHQNG